MGEIGYDRRTLTQRHATNNDNPEPVEDRDAETDSGYQDGEERAAG